MRKALRELKKTIELKALSVEEKKKIVRAYLESLLGEAIRKIIADIKQIKQINYVNVDKLEYTTHRGIILGLNKIAYKIKIYVSMLEVVRKELDEDEEETLYTKFYSDKIYQMLSSSFKVKDIIDDLINEIYNTLKETVKKYK